MFFPHSFSKMFCFVIILVFYSSSIYIQASDQATLSTENKKSVCENNACKNGGTCGPDEDSERNYKCSCRFTHTGKDCETEIDSCEPDVCNNGGTCKITFTRTEKLTCNCTTTLSESLDEMNAPINHVEDFNELEFCKSSATCKTVVSEKKKRSCQCPETHFGERCEKVKDFCKPDLCQNGGTCATNITRKERYQCTCPETHIGKHCETERDFCQPYLCKNGGTCISNITLKKRYFCRCPELYSGLHCENEKDFCKPHLCQNGGTCISNIALKKRYTCKCAELYCGKNCEKEKNFCEADTCKNGGTCTSDIKHEHRYTCNCTEPYSGQNCETIKDICETDYCKNGGLCSTVITLNKEEVCDCSGFNSLEHIDNETSLGTSDFCKNNRNCSTVITSDRKTICECPESHTGDRCEKGVCESHACKHGGKCLPDKTSIRKYKCQCPETHTGDTCTIGVCDVHLCKHGGTCLPNRTSLLNYTCTCPESYKGDMCEIDVCQSHECKNKGVCKPDKASPRMYKCKCPVTHTGDSCEIGVCESHNCEHEGKCIPDAASTNKFRCECAETHTGDMCEKDVCEKHLCKHNGTCIPNKTSTSLYRCKCPETHTGDRCEKDICASHKCKNEGVCVPDEFAMQLYICDCPETHTGELCDINVCDSHTCKSKGECVPDKSSKRKYRCKCPETRTGDSCEIERTDVCDPNPCKNNGTCEAEENEDTYVCDCTEMFTGKNCSDFKWCLEGEGATLCAKARCHVDEKTNAGYCDCADGEYFDYKDAVCKEIDSCAFKSCKENEVCRSSKCQCQENFLYDDKLVKCVPNFCSLNICEENEVCSEDTNNKGNVQCRCKNDLFHNGENCVSIDYCLRPGMDACQQICNKATQSCECLEGFKLHEDNRTCVLLSAQISSTDAKKSCSKKCGSGVCVSDGQNETCICPEASHIYMNNTCIDLCTAQELPNGLCPNDECQPHAKYGFICNCTGRYQLAKNGALCQKKIMCNDNKIQNICRQQNAICMNDGKNETGYRCVCPIGQGMENGVCKGLCELETNIKACNEKHAICDIKWHKGEPSADCKCPPALTFENGFCNKLAPYSYIGYLPVLNDKYAISQKSKSGFLFILLAASSKALDIDQIRRDIRDSASMLYNNVKFVDVISCSERTSQCLVEIQFESDPGNSVNLIAMPQSCRSIKEKPNACIIPPRLVLSKKTKRDLFSETDPCITEIKNTMCGKHMKCSKTEGRNFRCSCNKGFSTVRELKPFTDNHTIIEICQDIDECLDSLTCANTTTCRNTYGSYECDCLKGYRLSNKNSTEDDECVELCSPSPCGQNENCVVEGDYQYSCRCSIDFTGPKCDVRVIKPIKASEINAIIVGVVLGIAILIVAAIGIVKYRGAKNKWKNYDSSNVRTRETPRSHLADRPTYRSAEIGHRNAASDIEE